jgi:hypothetical protein
MTPDQVDPDRFVCLHCRKANDDGRPCPCLVVDQGVEEAAQAAIAPDAPLVMTDELLAAVQGRAVRDVLAARVRLIVVQGHTADSDDFLPIGWLPMEARQRFESARDLMTDDHRDCSWCGRRSSTDSPWAWPRSTGWTGQRLAASGDVRAAGQGTAQAQTAAPDHALHDTGLRRENRPLEMAL